MNSELSREQRMQMSHRIKAEALRLGFFSCGIAPAEPVDEEAARQLQAWLAAHGNADMDYMARNTDKRLNPALLMPGAKSLVCLAMSYAPEEEMPAEGYQIAAYAYGKDYHEIMKERLRKLAAELGWLELRNGEEPSTEGVHYRAFVDTAPLLERYWAERSGLGWTGRNHQLIIPHAGSMFFLGELLVDQTLAYDERARNRCGNCHRCIDACPTGAIALSPSGATLPLRSTLCLSYQTIENRGQLSPLAKEKMGNVIYGCDRCQRACPWNRFATPTREPSFRPSPALLQMTKAQWETLSEDDYRRLFKGSAVKRAKYEGLKRNIEAAKGTPPQP